MKNTVARLICHIPSLQVQRFPHLFIRSGLFDPRFQLCVLLFELLSLLFEIFKLFCLLRNHIRIDADDREKHNDRRRKRRA